MSARTRETRGNRAHRVDEEPMSGNHVRVKEELRADIALLEEVRSEVGDPLENGEACAGLEHEHGDRLLCEEADDDRWPAVGLAYGASLICNESRLTMGCLSGLNS